MSRSPLRFGAAMSAAVFLTISVAACGGSGGSSAAAGDGTGTITVWAHQGQDSENAALQAAVDGFNASQGDVTATLVLQPADNYTTTVQNTAVEDLPDVVEMDGPTVASFVYDQRISPLSEFVSPETVANATAGIAAEGTVGGELYALGMYDSAMGIYGNKALLDAAGVSYPTSVDDAWTGEQFTAAVEALAAADPDGKSLDIQEQNGLSGEWGTYAFAPLVWSAGGSLITDNRAVGALDSSQSVAALTALSSWKPYVDPNADGNAFPAGRVALGWGGHWNYPDYSEALGDQLVVLPLPDLGQGPKTGSGSWAWGIGGASQNAAAAGAFLDFLLNDTNVAAMTTANGAPAGTQSAAAAQTLYSDSGALALFGQQLARPCGEEPSSGCVATSRPVTAGYPVVTSSFGKALSAIWGGADPATELSTAAQTVDQAYADNGDYE